MTKTTETTIADQQNVEKEIESLLFNIKPAKIIKSNQPTSEDLSNKPKPKDQSLYFVDVDKQQLAANNDHFETLAPVVHDDKPLWVDEEDDLELVEQRRTEFQSIHKKSNKRIKTQNGELLKMSNIETIEKNTRIINNKKIAIQFNNINTIESKKPLKTVSYSLNGKVILASDRKGFSLFANNESKQMLLEKQSVEKNLKEAKFINNSEVLCCFNKNYVLLYDVQVDRFSDLVVDKLGLFKQINSAKFNHDRIALFDNANNGGYIDLLDRKTKMMIKTLKIDDLVDVELDSQNHLLHTLSSNGKVNTFDMRMLSDDQLVVEEFRDNELYKCNKLSVSSNQILKNNTRLMSISMADGSIRTYKLKNNKTKFKKEHKNFKDNKIIKMQYNFDAQLLCVLGKNSLSNRSNIRIINTQTLNVYDNWPSNHKSLLQNINDFNFSSNSTNLIIGNSRGSIFDLNIKHYMDLFSQSNNYQ